MSERNVVVLTFDSLRADHVGHLGYDRDTTPTIDAMAEQGTTFTNAISPASRTNPSMSGILTGEPLVVRDRVANPEHSRSHLERHGTLAERMAEKGYATGAFNPNAYASRYYGFDRGFEDFEDFLFGTDRYQELFEDHLGDGSLSTLLRNARNFVRRQEAFKTWDTYVDDVEQWAGDQDEPFFLWAFSLDTHFPYITPREHREWSNFVEMYYYNWKCNQLIDALDPDISDRTRRKMIDIYDDSIRFADVFVAELQERLAEYDPIFVIFGDHGEAFAERDVYGHFYPSLYEENVHVPFVTSAGDGERIDDPISLTAVPDVVEHLAATGEVAYPENDWAVATDYDGRYDRNVVAARTKDWTYIVERQDGAETHECFELTDRPAGAEKLAHDLPADRSDEQTPLTESLRRLAERRFRHEDEVLAIREAVAELDDTGQNRRAATPDSAVSR